MREGTRDKPRRAPRSPLVWSFAAALLLASCGGGSASDSAVAEVAASVPEVTSLAVNAVPLSTDSTDQFMLRMRDDVVFLGPLRESAQLTRVRETLSQLGVSLSDARQRGQGAVVLRLAHPVPLDTANAMAAAMLAADTQWASIEVDRRLELHGLPSDPRLPEQWHLAAVAGTAPSSAINLPAAWDKSTGVGVVIGVVDTGVRPHADIAPNLLPGYDFISNAATAADGDARDSDAQDPGNGVLVNECGEGQAARASLWHGTHVAGTLAAVMNNQNGGIGVASGAKLLPLRVMGHCGGYVSDVADAIIWASGGTVSGLPVNPTPARVINLSMGVSGACGDALQAAVKTARTRGAVLVASAGNAAGDVSSYAPANCDGVIAVTAVDRHGQKAVYANTGAHVALAAPGGDMRSEVTGGILSTYNTGVAGPGMDSMGYLQGTSMSAPLVSGVVALMLARNPTLTPDEIATRITGSVRPFPSPCYGCGAGLLDASAAIDAATGIRAEPQIAQQASAGVVVASSALGASAVAPSMVAAVNEWEPNDALSTAQVLVLASPSVQAVLHDGEDVDHYRLNMAAGGAIQLVLTAEGAAQLSLSVVSDTGVPLAAIDADAQHNTIWVRNVSPLTEASLYVRVTYVKTAPAQTSARYRLQVLPSGP